MEINTDDLYQKTDSESGFKYRKVKSSLSVDAQRRSQHTLTHNAIFFQLGGELKIFQEDGQSVLVSPGQFYFLPRGARVSACIVGHEVEYLVARLDHDLNNRFIFNQLFKEEGWNRQTEHTFSTLPIKEPLIMFVESMKYYIINKLDSHRLHDIKFVELYILFRSCYTTEECQNIFYPILTATSKFKTYILDNYNVSVSIGDLASKANMSRSTFDRNFKEDFGMTPHKWIDLQTRILIFRKASEPNVTVKDIMYEVGVYNSSQFTKLCRRICGVTPSMLVR